MKSLKALVFISGLLALAACVTINVYFPAAAAERAAEEFVGDVLGEPEKEGSLFPKVTPEHQPLPSRRKAVEDAGSGQIILLKLLCARLVSKSGMQPLM